MIGSIKSELLNRQRLYVRLSIASLVSVALVAAGLGLFSVFAGRDKPAVKVNGGVLGESTFEAVVPDTFINDNNVVNYDPSAGVASYQDQIDGSLVAVSQQPLSKKQQSNPNGELQQLAQSLGAIDSFDTKKGIVFVTGTDNTDQQVALFFTKELFIIIRTTDTYVSTQDLSKYVNSLD